MTKTMMVTGAAAGIGRAIARRFAQAGYRVGAYDVDTAGLATLADELGDRVVIGELDVRDAAGWQASLADLTKASDGALHVLVNNAGILRSGAFTDIALEDQRAIVDVNVTGVLNGCHTAYPFLRAADGAHVVNLASASAIYGQPDLATYSASKFAVRGLTEALDLEWADDRISVTALWPLFVDTAMVTGMDTGATRSLGIRLTAEDVAEAALAAVRPRSRYAGVHRAVGRQAKALLTSSQLAPSAMLRAMNRRIADR
ncbi:SDR family oxidoreductase [Nocardioides massiliensis]|uniref:Short-subunit dehydrogenase n=1 Tax=Nocardioides massiliensis TaxID=1325935 RepID=A0ABT9NNC1_9ACTN|nr:SDR family oxidoreductase [Nocardioides massiliensis]MDP9821916.1 short-subunit dehydrogenase [Nocardioides massiliensis]